MAWYYPATSYRSTGTCHRWPSLGVHLNFQLYKGTIEMGTLELGWKNSVKMHIECMSWIVAKQKQEKWTKYECLERWKKSEFGMWIRYYCMRIIEICSRIIICIDSVSEINLAASNIFEIFFIRQRNRSEIDSIINYNTNEDIIHLKAERFCYRLNVSFEQKCQHVFVTFFSFRFYLVRWSFQFSARYTILHIAQSQFICKNEQNWNIFKFFTLYGVCIASSEIRSTSEFFIWAILCEYAIHSIWDNCLVVVVSMWISPGLSTAFSYSLSLYWTGAICSLNAEH